MKIKKLIQLFIGITGALVFMMGFIFLLGNPEAAKIYGVVVLSLGLISGLILPNPVSIAGFFIGLFMLILPAQAVGVALIILGIAIMAVSLFWWIKGKNTQINNA
ncbi:MAG: hypothetical protein IJ298_02080 [Ruminococcus sp.]|nr:hypothetical protein [Ruminococcus sp.]